MAADEEIFEDWDAAFLDEMIQAEELALSSTNPTQFRNPQPPVAPPPYTSAPSTVRSSLPPLTPALANVAYNLTASAASNIRDISYSPPRELSQRPSGSKGRFVAPVDVQELEIERLKKELERVSSQLSGLERECMELKSERDKTNKQLKSVFANAAATKNNDNCLKIEIAGRESEVLVKNHPGAISKCQIANINTEYAGQLKSKSCQAVGIQTDHDGNSPSFDVKEEPNIGYYLREKLQSIWSPSSGHRSRSFITKLLVICTADFSDLFGYLGLTMSTKITDSLERELSSCLASGNYINSSSSAESTRISYLCSVLFKIRDGMIQVDALVDILLDLCNMENVHVIHKSLCILRAALAILSNVESRHGSRDNIMIDGQTIEAIYGISKDASSEFSGKSIKDSTLLDMKGQWGYGKKLLSQVNYVRIFQKMCMIALESAYKQVQLEAISIMNAILVGTNAFSEREEYGESMVFEAVAHLLNKEADLSLQREAVRQLHLLLNCPKILAKFCLDWKGLEKSAEATDGAKSGAIKVSHTILQGVAGCISQYGNDAQDIKLRRNTTVLLAFLASSGTPGFEIVLSHKLSEGDNFLGLILRALSSDIDAEASESEPSTDITKERTLFMREALILLNRLVSNPATSAAALQLLTSNRDMISFSVDIASRLSRECKQVGTSDLSLKRIKPSEVTELAKVFKKRIFSYMGESVSS